MDLYASSDETIHAYATWHYTPGVVVAGADPDRLRGGVGAGTAGGRHRRQWHILEAAQRGDVGIPGPAAVRVGADDTDAISHSGALPHVNAKISPVTPRDMRGKNPLVSLSCCVSTYLEIYAQRSPSSERRTADQWGRTNIQSAFLVCRWRNSSSTWITRLSSRPLGRRRSGRRDCGAFRRWPEPHP